MLDHALGLAAITLAAAIVNGALGYGFSSLTVPVALLFLTNRVLNPALVIVEVALNGYMLWVNRAAVPAVQRRVRPVLVGLVPGIVVGTAILSHVSPAGIRFGTFLVLLPLILFQAAGYRRPVRSEASTGALLGVGVGTLYAVTTISIASSRSVSLNRERQLDRDVHRHGLSLPSTWREAPLIRGLDGLIIESVSRIERSPHATASDLTGDADDAIEDDGAGNARSHRV